MDLVVKSTKGEDTGRKVSLNKDVFGYEPNDHAIYLDVKQYLANQRQGTHQSKERGEIVGSTRKIKKQKGSGTARAGSIKSPLFRGGGRVFGPKPRNYSFKLNKKLKVVARVSALSYKAKEAQISIVEDFTFDGPKTKDYVNLLNGLQVNDKKSLFVMPTADANLAISGRNIPNTKVVTVDQINTYDILNADALMIAEGSVEKINALLK